MGQENLRASRLALDAGTTLCYTAIILIYLEFAERAMDISQVIEYLANGMNPSEIATATGNSVDAIREAMKDKDNQVRLVARAKALRAERNETSYGKLEEHALKKAAELVDNTYEMSDVTRLLETITRNRVALRIPAANTYQNPTIGQQNNTIILQLPAAASAEKVLTDSKNQVIAIGERTMAALPINGVQALFVEMEKMPKVPVVRQEIVDLVELMPNVDGGYEDEESRSQVARFA